MAVHTYRYRYSAEVEITVDDDKAPQQQAEEIAGQAVEEHAYRLIDGDTYGLLGKEVLSPGVTGEVVKMATWDRI
ncbi:hypothetical protein K9F62_03285 [Desulfovibrio sp. JY]|nr:hypothetical protein K9F62_03285 [Desulfovibrio sp. JY]